MSSTTVSQGRDKSSRRRRYIVRPSFQWKYIGLVVAAVFVISLFLSFVLFGILYQQARALTLHPPATSAENVGLIVTLTALAFTVAPAAALGIIAMIVTHRICGPIYVIEGYLRQLQEGRLPEPRSIRKHDEFKAFYAEFGMAMDSLRARERASRARLTSVHNKAASAGGGDLEACRKALESIASDLRPFCTGDIQAPLSDQHPVSDETNNPDSASVDAAVEV